MSENACGMNESWCSQELPHHAGRGRLWQQSPGPTSSLVGDCHPSLTWSKDLSQICKLWRGLHRLCLSFLPTLPLRINLFAFSFQRSLQGRPWTKQQVIIHVALNRLSCSLRKKIPKERKPALHSWGCVLSWIQLFATPWPIVYQASLSMGFSRQEYWSGLPLPSPGHLLTQGSSLGLLCLLHWQVASLPLSHPGSHKNHLGAF